MSLKINKQTPVFDSYDIRIKGNNSVMYFTIEQLNDLRTTYNIIE